MSCRSAVGAPRTTSVILLRLRRTPSLKGMALRCFLFSSDEGTSDLIRQVMTGLGVEGESCPEAATAVERLAQELFQIVVVDWDQQPEASMLLSAARERKPADRPLTLAIVSDDASVPKALQAGANSILKKPLLLNQVTDTLTTARDLLRSRGESAASAAHAAAAASASSPSIPSRSAPDKALQGGEFRQTTPVALSGQFETDSEVAHFPEESVTSQIDPLKDLEPVAASVQQEPRAIPLPPPQNEPKGLEWYLKARGVSRQPSAASPPPPPPSDNAKPELLGYDQPKSHSDAANTTHETQAAAAQEATEVAAREKKQEAQLFSYIAGETEKEKGPSRFRIGKGAIAVAIVLATCAIVAAPQAPWHPKLLIVWSRGKHALHAWLNPQPVTAVAQAPTSHEDFGRPGDEYKLPVAENIPDATTDPSQISVVPVVDPTARKPVPDSTVTDPAATAGGSLPAPGDGSASVPLSTSTQPVQSADSTPPNTGGELPPSPAPASAPPDVSSHSESPAASATPVPSNPLSTRPPAARQPTQYIPVTTKVPSSLQSQMVTMVPEASGNKPPESALPSIEPVEVPELTERALLADQPPLAYPANAAGKQGTVILQVLIGRDGTVQDAKFLQGSLAFARAAIDGVKQWKFKPYTMNGRPVSVQTNLTLKFAPAQ